MSKRSLDVEMWNSVQNGAKTDKTVMVGYGNQGKLSFGYNKQTRSTEIIRIMNQEDNIIEIREEQTKDTTEETFQSEEMLGYAAPHSIDIWEETLKWFQERQILPGNTDVLRCRVLPQSAIKPSGKGLCLKKLNDRLKKKLDLGIVKPENSCA